MRERDRETWERAFKGESLLGDLLFTAASAALAGSQKKTSPHYYFMHTNTFGSLLCMSVTVWC